MSTNKNLGLLAIAAFMLLTVTQGCSKLCNSGYEGSRCNQLTTTKFIAKWSAVDTPGNLIYTDTVTQGPAIEDITLSASFAGHYFAHHINASTVANVITIPYQQPDSGITSVQGTGTLSDDQSHISFTYQIIVGLDSPQVITNYAGTWTRQN